MERHRCKLCLKTFANGRGLGGHMKVHLANVSLPPKTEQQHHHHHQHLEYHIDSTPSSSSFSSGEEDDCEGKEEVERRLEGEEKALVYALRENPKKSFILADPEFSFAVDGGGGAVVQDRESETESKNPTHRRTKRRRGKPITVGIQHLKGINRKMELKRRPGLEKGSSSESPSEPEPVSSVSCTSPEEDVAMCLMMLSRDTWTRHTEEQDHVEEEVHTLQKKRKGPKDEAKSKRIRGKHQCENCRKTFRSSRALNSHRRICFPDQTLAGNSNEKIFECPFCFQLFGSGQALGGHKRSHLIGLSSTTTSVPAKNKETFLDLNLPAPAEDDDFSVVSES